MLSRLNRFTSRHCTAASAPILRSCCLSSVTASSIVTPHTSFFTPQYLNLIDLPISHQLYSSASPCPTMSSSKSPQKKSPQKSPKKSPKKSPASSSSSSSAAAAAAVSEVTVASVFRQTAASNTQHIDFINPSLAHYDTSRDHLILPHQDEQFWASTQKALEPLASYYLQHIQSAKRGSEQTATAAAGASSAAAAASSSSGNPPKGSPYAAIWRQHYVPSSVKAPPVFPSDQCLAFLRSVRHPSQRKDSFTGKSLLQTLDVAMDPHDRAHVFQVILPYAAQLVLQLPTLFPNQADQSTAMDTSDAASPPSQSAATPYCLPKLVRGVDATVTLSAAQCACLLACQMLSLIGSRTAHVPGGTANNNEEDEEEDEDSTWPTCNFHAFFSATRVSVMTAKHLMVLNYFARIENPAEGIPSRYITFHRRVMDDQALAIFEDLSADRTPLGPVEYHETGSIEDAPNALQADFANMYIGGGVLYTGCVQEEIRFCVSPECIVSMVLCESMMENESILIYGSNQYSHYAGYGSDLRFGSDCRTSHPTETKQVYDEYQRSANVIVAIDAIDFNENHGSHPLSPSKQWEEEHLLRETLKAYVGFSVEQKYMGEKYRYDDVATGNWGCGAFGGFPPLKFLLQWYATSLANRRLIYYSFGNPLAQSIPAFVAQLQSEFPASPSSSSATAPSSSSAAAASSPHAPITVGELWSVLVAIAPKYMRMKSSQLTHDGLLHECIVQLRKLRGLVVTPKKNAQSRK